MESPVITLDMILSSGMFTAFVFVFGCCIGSFLNVVIYRLPQGLSVNNPSRSFCTTSGQTIPWYDNIPVISFLLLKGKSRFDGKPISWRYPIVELLTGVLFVAVWVMTHRWHSGQFWWLIALIYMMITAGLIAASFIDLDHFIIPDEISKTGIVLGIALSAAVPDLHVERVPGMMFKDAIGEAFLASIVGAIAGYGMLWLIGEFGRMAFKKDAMGMGDMKLLAGLGAFLGFKAVIFIIMAGSLFGSAVGLVLIVTKRLEKYSRIPFGPYLALGALFWILGGSEIMEWYIRYITLPVEQLPATTNALPPLPPVP